MADETRTLAKFVTNFKLEDAPAPNRDRMHDLLVDQIGVETGCSHLPWAQQVHETYRRVGGAPETTVLAGELGSATNKKKASRASCFGHRP